ncbi:hypothetical protein [Chryseobacterium carnipullorum]|uniref:hypothetical protein n=1 Tax=Chryseobacterium carnipullorum TaxID=1124835 RepID=UPI001E4798A3|nr:hypothetical protein [Chryseobacterium carnipullorum]
MTKPFILREYIFVSLFWLVFAAAVYINFQANSDKPSAVFQTITLVIASFIFTHFLTTRLLPHALRAKKMKLFLIQATGVILLLSFIYSLIFTYIEVSSKNELPHDFVNHLPFYGKDSTWPFPRLFLSTDQPVGSNFIRNTEE